MYRLCGQCSRSLVVKFNVNNRQFHNSLYILFDIELNKKKKHSKFNGNSEKVEDQISIATVAVVVVLFTLRMIYDFQREFLRLLLF